MKLATLKRPRVFVPMIAVVLLFVGGMRARRPVVIPYATAVAKRMDLVQKTSVTGRVKPAEAVDLAFETAGRVDLVRVAVGDRVRAKQVLIQLDVSQLQAQLAQARESVSREQAAFMELQRGTRPEELAIASTNVSNAQKALEDATANFLTVQEKARVDLQNLSDGVPDILRDALTKADDALSKQLDELFDNDGSSTPTLTFSTDGQLATDAQSQRVSAGSAIAAFREDVHRLLPPQSALELALTRMRPVVSLLDTLGNAVDASTNLTLTTRATYKSNVNTARTNLNTAVAAVNKQEQLIVSQQAANENAITAAASRKNDAQGAIDRFRAELALKAAGATAEQIAGARAQLKQAQARQAEVMVEIARLVLVSPIDGVVTSVASHVGEIVAVNVPVVSLMSSGALEIKANVPEADIAKVKVSALAEVTLDAYPSDVVFAAHVVSIDPSETIVDGVATYTTTLEFVGPDPRIKSGMTANLEIVGSSRKNSIAIPARAVSSDGGAKHVRRLFGARVDEVEVKTGLSDADGNVEILQGLQEGDTVIVS